MSDILIEETRTQSLKLLRDYKECMDRSHARNVVDGDDCFFEHLRLVKQLARTCTPFPTMLELRSCLRAHPSRLCGEDTRRVEEEIDEFTMRASATVLIRSQGLFVRSAYKVKSIIRTAAAAFLVTKELADMACEDLIDRRVRQFSSDTKEDGL